MISHQSFSLRNFNKASNHVTAVVSKFDKMGNSSTAQANKKKVYNIREAIQKNDLVRIR